VEDFDDVLVILLGDVAATYVEIRTAEQRLLYARTNVANQRGSLTIAEQKFEQGATSRLDVAQALSNVAQTEATIPVLETQLRQAQNRLCVLLGIPPQNINAMLAASRGIPKASPEVVVGIPADLLRRRPDVRRAERLAAAQSARIGIAEADMYPAFSINGSLSWVATDFKDLFNSSALAGTLSPGFRWNILNYGRLRNNVLAQDAVFQQLVTAYQQTVLVANQEAEDALIGFLRAQEEARARRDSVNAAQESSDIVNLLYQGGRADFGRVFVAEFFLVQQQDLYAQAEGSIAGNLVDLYRALGGGWQIRLNGPPPPIAVQPVSPQPVPLPAVPTPAAPPEGPGAGQAQLTFPENALRK
jgi:NodT family efflux transporter outer membrane factor (OMF) lipoprotein